VLALIRDENKKALQTPQTDKGFFFKKLKYIANDRAFFEFCPQYPITKT
jgi:hypothetical protein